MGCNGASEILLGRQHPKLIPAHNSYFLTLTSFQPLYGKLSDIFGRKPTLLFGYAIFGTGCLFCGLARNMNELIAARVSLSGT